MASIILKQMASSLARRALHHSRFCTSLASSAACYYRCLRTLSAAPSPLLWSSAKINAVQTLPSSLPSSLPCLQPSASMKTKTALKRRCKDCFFVRRRGHLFVFCKTHPRHKQRQA